MSTFRRKTIWLLALAAVAIPTTAQAEIYRGIAKGLSLFDFRFSGQRNLLGDGITVNANAAWNNRRFDFGVADLTLTGGINATAGYTMRGIPSVNFSMNSGGAPLAYSFNVNNGIQEINATGTALVNISTQINAFGFYDESVQISNRGTYAASGYGLVDSGSTNYDIGPINVHGNVFADALGAISEPFFSNNNLENPFVKFSGRAARAALAEKTANDLRARVQGGEVLNDQDIAKLVNETLVAAMLGGDPQPLDDLLLPTGLLNADGTPTGIQTAAFNVAPEPSAVMLLGLGLAAFRRRRAR